LNHRSIFQIVRFDVPDCQFFHFTCRSIVQNDGFDDLDDRSMKLTNDLILWIGRSDLLGHRKIFQIGDLRFWIMVKFLKSAI